MLVVSPVPCYETSSISLSPNKFLCTEGAKNPNYLSLDIGPILPLYGYACPDIILREAIFLV
jgi:hypothetical protein